MLHSPGGSLGPLTSKTLQPVGLVGRQDKLHPGPIRCYTLLFTAYRSHNA